MKINVSQIPAEGFFLEESVLADELDLQTDLIKFYSPLRIKAKVFKITNAVTVDVILNAKLYLTCSRCLTEFEIDFEKSQKLNYQVNRLTQLIDLNSDIREEIILDYPIKHLCRPDCKGLCHKCGKDLNEGDCNCLKFKV